MRHSKKKSQKSFLNRFELSDTLFVIILLLPLLGILIMDYQVRVANDITGHIIAIDNVSSNANPPVISSIVILTTVIAIILVGVGRFRRKRLEERNMVDDVAVELKKIRKKR